MPKKHLAIIGHGMAGSRLLDELLSRGAADRYTISIFGEEPGAAYNRILLSKVLGGHDREAIHLKPQEWHAGDDVNVMRGIRIDRIETDKHLLQSDDGRMIPYDIAVHATGSRAFVPPIAGTRTRKNKPKPGVFVYRTLDDALALRTKSRPGDNAVVLGGGLLGLEAAKALSDIGLHVTVLHLDGHLMNTQLDEPAGKMLQTLIERTGIFVRCGRTIKELVGDDQVRGVTLDDGTYLAADLVVMACGIRPNVDLAKASGIPVNRAVPVNDTLATQVPGVYAVGECAEHRGTIYGIVTPIWEQCKVLAEVLCGRVNGKLPRYTGSKLYTRLKVAGIEVASMGLTNPQLSSERTVQVIEPVQMIFRKMILRGDKLVGAHLVGETSAAARLIQIFDHDESVPANPLELLCDFSAAGCGASAGERQVCNCNAVSEGQIVDCIRNGAETVEAVGAATRAGTGCGSCRSQIVQLIRKNAPVTA
jgi:nitrite reductase (NADH) large subunit